MRTTRDIIGGVIFSVLILNQQAYSQKFKVGFSIGLSHNQLISDVSNLPLTKISGRFGHYGAIHFTYSIRERFDFSLASSYILKNFAQSRTDTLTGLFDIYNNGYFQLSPYLTYKLSIKKLFVSVSAGAFWSRWIEKRLEGSALNLYNSQIINGSTSTLQQFSSTNYNQSVSFDSRKDNRIEIGLNLGIGLGYILNSYSIVTEVRLFNSFEDQQLKYMINQIGRYNKTFIYSMTLSKTF